MSTPIQVHYEVLVQISDKSWLDVGVHIHGRGFRYTSAEEARRQFDEEVARGESARFLRKTVELIEWAGP